jgi:hypothetical protein
MKYDLSQVFEIGLANIANAIDRTDFTSARCDMYEVSLELGEIASSIRSLAFAVGRMADLYAIANDIKPEDEV